MSRLRSIVASCLTVTAFALAAPAAHADNPVAPVDGGTATAQCYAAASSQVDDPGYKACRSVAELAAMAAAACRTPLYSAPDASLPDYCGVFDGREVSEARVAAYERSWVHRALALQRGLDADAPLWEEQIPHTHNSFNASAYRLPDGATAPSYYPTLTNQDPNQVYSLTDQMRMDVRAIELDLHWVPSPYAPADGSTGGYWVTLCHGDGEDPTGQGLYLHVGCTDDRPMQDGLAEVRRWLDANPGQFLLVYFENQLDPGGPLASRQQAHDVAARIVAQRLGPLVYQPPQSLPAGTCAPMPYAETRAHLLSLGKRVLIVGNCGPGEWNRWVFTRGPAWDESGDPSTYTVSDCRRDQAAREDHSSFRRYFEERTWVSAVGDGLPGPLSGRTETVSPQGVADMVRCGVNIIGFDQLEPFDGRLAALVWSWAPGQPTATGADCAYQGADGRFRPGGCGVPRHFACVDAHLDWHVTARTGPWWAGFDACARELPGTSYGVPPNGYRNAQLSAGAPADRHGVWLDYRRVAGRWVAGAPPVGRGGGPQPPAHATAAGSGSGPVGPSRPVATSPATPPAPAPADGRPARLLVAGPLPAVPAAHRRRVPSAVWWPLALLLVTGAVVFPRRRRWRDPLR